MQKYYLTRFVVVAVIILAQVTVMVDAQTSTASDLKSLTLESWSPYFPLLAGCDVDMSVIVDDQQGTISQTAQYHWKSYGGELLIVSAERPSECGSVSISMKVPYTPAIPPIRILSKEEQKAEKELEKRTKKAQKQIEKMNRITKDMYHNAPAPPPYPFYINGFEAYQFFNPPTDCLGCEDLDFATIVVKIASDKQLNARLIGNREGIKQILEKIDFEKLNAAMNIYADSHKKPVTK